MAEHPILFSDEMVKAILEGRKTQTRRVLRKQPRDISPMNVPNMWMIHKESGAGQIIGCNYGRPGDRLWVRETWAKAIPLGASIHAERVYHYRADGDVLPKWKPSIFMPRWASRITLEIVRVRVQRLQEISGDECTLEGVEVAWSDPNNNEQERAAFQNLWDRINAARGCGWNVNPWVWVIEFKKL